MRPRHFLLVQLLAISLSSEVMPEIKEFERTSTTTVNAYVKPLMARYVKRLEERLAAQGFARGLFMMLSGGGRCVSWRSRALLPTRSVPLISNTCSPRFSCSLNQALSVCRP